VYTWIGEYRNVVGLLKCIKASLLELKHNVLFLLFILKSAIFVVEISISMETLHPKCKKWIWQQYQTRIRVHSGSLHTSILQTKVLNSNKDLIVHYVLCCKR